MIALVVCFDFNYSLFQLFYLFKKTHFIYSRFNESSSRDPRIFLINVCTVTSFDLLKESVYRGIKSGVGINDFQHRLFFLKGFSLNVFKFGKNAPYLMSYILCKFTQILKRQTLFEVALNVTYSLRKRLKGTVSVLATAVDSIIGAFIFSTQKNFLQLFEIH